MALATRERETLFRADDERDAEPEMAQPKKRFCYKKKKNLAQEDMTGRLREEANSKTPHLHRK